jgi:hypothetical protein
VVAVEHGDEPLGQAVELVEAVREPGDELLLRLEEQRGADAADHLQVRQVPLVEVLLGEEGDDLRRHEHHVCNPLGRQRLDRPPRVEGGLEDVRAAEVPGRHQCQERAVEDERTGVEDDALRPDPERRRESGAVRGPDPVRVHDPLRLPGRARAVDDVVRVVVRDRHRRRRRLGVRGRVDERPKYHGSGRSVAGDEQTPCRHRQTVPDPVQISRVPRHRHQGGRVGIVREVGEALAPQQRAERDDDETGLRGGVVELEQLERVVEHERDLVALREAEAQERVRRPVHAAV